MAVKYGSLPFQQAIDFFREKVRLPTASWTDIWQGMHARAFTVAGVTRDDMLLDFQQAIDKAISQGTTLREFRGDFDTIIDKFGWGYNGGRNWRSRVIYDTNLRTAYQAGRYQQMQQVTDTRPFWAYKHSDAVETPRPQHLAWDGLVLRHDDPFWDTHYPPNGWGCQCSVRTLSERDLNKLGKTGPDIAPPLINKNVLVGQRGPSPRTVSVPNGIDAGWAYNVGEAAFGKNLADDIMQQWQKTKLSWVPMSLAGWAEAGRPEKIPLQATNIKLAEKVASKEELQQLIEKTLAGKERYQLGSATILIDAERLASHVDINRSEYIPLLDDTLSNPYEVWLSFERHKGTGKYALRSRIIKGYDLGKGRILLMVANSIKGELEGWTFLPTADKRYIQRQRVGELIYASD